MSLPNIVTIARIILSIVLFFTSPDTPVFLLLYAFCGLSDILDGYIARKTHSETKFGEKLDSISDFIFLIVSASKIIPHIEINKYILIWIFLILLLKITAMAIRIKNKQSITIPHTIANKITGVAIYFLGLWLLFFRIDCPTIIVCALSSFASIQEISLAKVD